MSRSDLERILSPKDAKRRSRFLRHRSGNISSASASDGSFFTYSPAGGLGWKSSDLLKFCVFARELAPEDEDADDIELSEPILYFYPSDIAPNERVKFMNTVLGLNDFMRNFSDDPRDKITAVHLEDSRLAIFECEPDIWFVVEVSCPQRIDSELDDPGGLKAASSSSTSASDEVSDICLRKIVQDTYGLYHLFRGKIRDMLIPPQYSLSGREQDAPILRLKHLRVERRKASRYVEMRDRGDLLNPSASQTARMQKFESGQLDEELALLSARSPIHGVRKALRTLVPVYIDGVDFSQLHYFHRLDGFQFFPVDKTVYTNVHSFVTSVESQFPQVQQVALTYCGHLVWSTIEPNQTRLILRFIRYHEMIGEHRLDSNVAELNGSSSADASQQASGGKGLDAKTGKVCGFMSTVRGIWVQAEIQDDSDRTNPDAVGDAPHRNHELQIFAPPIVLNDKTTREKNSSASGSTGEHDIDSSIPPKHSRSLSAYHRVGPNGVASSSHGRIGRNGVAHIERNHDRGPSQMFEQSEQSSLMEMDRAGSAAAESGARHSDRESQADGNNSQNPLMHKLVVYKRGPMLLIMVVNATGMKQLEDSDVPNQKDLQGTSKGSARTSGPDKLGEGVKSLPAFCRLLHKHAGKPLGQLTSMLEDGYTMLDTRHFNTASPGGQTNFSYNGSGDTTDSRGHSSDRPSKSAGSSSVSRRSEYRFVYFNGKFFFGT